jgi:hypothetical protein
MIYLFLGCQDAEVPLGQTFQPAAKISVFPREAKLPSALL